MPKLPSLAVRRELDALGIQACSLHQPQGLFRPGPRKLAQCPNPDDPWRVLLYRTDRVCWADGAYLGMGEGDTPDEAVRNALLSVRTRRCMGGLSAAMTNLAVEMDMLTSVLATGEIPF